MLSSLLFVQQMVLAQSVCVYSSCSPYQKIFQIYLVDVASKHFFRIFLMVFRVCLITTVTYPTLWVMIEVGHGARVIYYNSDRMCSIT